MRDWSIEDAGWRMKPERYFLLSSLTSILSYSPKPFDERERERWMIA
jgi:hypothetical protein